MDRDEALMLLGDGSRGVAEWNRRKRAGEAIPDLSRMELSDVVLDGIDLHGARLTEVDLTGSSLEKADLRGANLTSASAHDVSLRHASLFGACLSDACIGEADLRGADLSETELYWTRFFRTDARDASFYFAIMAHTVFALSDLLGAEGLETVEHKLVSSIDVMTLDTLRPVVPPRFLTGCGVPLDLMAWFSQSLMQDARTG
jgi:uncharacterized protein YjbI with pentapeptide repeats